jgi:hypothetical protein
MRPGPLLSRDRYAVPSCGVEAEPVRLAELLAALSLATDLGMGQPRGHAIQTCVLSVRLAREIQLPEDQVSDVFYVALLRYLGCTARRV